MRPRRSPGRPGEPVDRSARSASRAGDRPLHGRAAIRSASTSQTGQQLGGLRRGGHGVPGEQAPAAATRCARRRPAARRRRAAAARWSWAAEARRGRRGPADQHRQDRVGLLRHRRGPATALAAGSASSAISGRARSEHVVGDVPIASVAVDQRVADRGDRCAAGVPRRAIGRGRAAAVVGGQRNGRPRRTRRRRELGRSAAQGAGGAAELDRQAASGARRSSPARRARRAASCAALSPKVIGTACWVRVRPAIRSPRCRRPVAASASTWRLEVARAAGRGTSRSTAPARCRARPGWSDPGAASGPRPGPPASRSRSSATSGMTGLPPASAPVGDRGRSSSARDQACGDRVGGVAGAAIPAAGQRPAATANSTVDHGLEDAPLVGTPSPARSSPGPEQVAHADQVPGRSGTRSRRRPAAGCRSAARRRRRRGQQRRRRSSGQRGQQRVARPAPRRRPAGRPG